MGKKGKVMDMGLIRKKKENIKRKIIYKILCLGIFGVGWKFCYLLLNLFIREIEKFKFFNYFIYFWLYWKIWGKISGKLSISGSM